VLTAYLTQTRRLLQLPAAPATLYTEADLTSYINTARGQLCGETECLRAIGTVNTIPGQMAYNFSAIAFALAGVQGAINVRRISWNDASGQRWIEPRPWEYFDFYVLLDPLPPVNQSTGVTGDVPSVWAQYSQGSAPSSAVGNANGGSFYINIPDDTYALNCDCSCYPIPLVDDGTVEVIPYLWTDAVPFYAAYYALMSSQMQARMSDALRYFEMYKEFIKRARQAANPSQLRWMYEGAADVPTAAQLGIKQGAG
jgi:hypothetical protein